MLWQDAASCPLAHDLHHRLWGGARAVQGLLRLRTSPEFGLRLPDGCYGYAVPDPVVEDLFHVAGCDAETTLVFDFEARGPLRGAGEDCPPTLQLAFAYTARLRDDGTCGGEASARVARRLVVTTLQAGVTRDADEVYKGADLAPVVALLTHKIVGAARTHAAHAAGAGGAGSADGGDDGGEAGLDEAKLLLKDWLVFLLARYNLSSRERRPSARAGSGVDTGFARHGHLALLLRHVYGLLASDALRPDGAWGGARGGAARLCGRDRRCFLQALYCRLPPAQLMKALYPVLLSYDASEAGANVVASQKRHYLTRTALRSGHPFFVLDALTKIYVYARGDAPPPRGSTIWADVTARVNQCLALPVLGTIQEQDLAAGTGEAEEFKAFLVEDPASRGSPTGGGGGGENGMSFGQFATAISDEVLRFMQITGMQDGQPALHRVDEEDE